ncbi:L-serine ammonia-lyase [Thioalkalivibrio sp. XN8]|uniref:L-serine ammonia-lyase n=1 Tax=Thioalkalivibrio sp. XN8 TaxID=2712863 RepID=UPI0013EE3BFF|nr:L-serine ammonia-lyase [Thioalkalivibrio sp. XN8]
MAISIFDLIKVGVGPSSSHTMGPMLAARRFLLGLEERDLLGRVHRVGAQLYGSLALTGKGHCTDRAILLGFEGEIPETLEPAAVEARLARIRDEGRLRLLGEHEIAFDEPMDLLFHREQVLQRHTNGMRFSAFDAAGGLLASEDFYSIGGGFIVSGDEPEARPGDRAVTVPFPFDSAADLLEQCRRHGLKIHELVIANETAWRPPEETRARLLELWQVMKDCVQQGFHAEGVLPGVLKLPRRAPRLYRELCGEGAAGDFMDWVNAYALAVNEENAAGGRIVTAPTNGAAGILPAVLHYYRRFVSGGDEEGVLRFLLTAGAIAILYKRNASISGAEMGCQGEVGVACSMAAGGLVAAMGGSNAQVENAAEIGMEHNLGLTCDPIAGLVQIPCIERNAMGAVKAVNAARMAFRGDGSHKVSLDQVIATMRQTGLDMSTSYKETSQGGLAVNVPEC